MEGGWSAVKEVFRNDIRDWDNEDGENAIFKAFNGQRSEWEDKYVFWRDLIINIARHLRIFIISPSQVKNWFSRGGMTPLCIDDVLVKNWFSRGGMTPLCIDDVLFLMYNDGYIIRREDIGDPAISWLSAVFRGIINFVQRSAPMITLDDQIVVVPALKDKAEEVVKTLSEAHSTTLNITTMKRFQEFSGGANEASVLLSYLSGCGKAMYLAVRQKDFIEGVKISFSTGCDNGIKGLEHGLLHLIWTREKLHERLDAIERRCEMSNKLARSKGNKNLALIHLKALQAASKNKEKYWSFINRIEEIIHMIEDAELMAKVSEAMKLGALAIKESSFSLEEFQHCVDELDRCVNLQRQFEISMESSWPYVSVEDEEVEGDFEKLQLEVISDTSLAPAPLVGADGEITEASADSLSSSFSTLSLTNPIVAKEKRNRYPALF